MKIINISLFFTLIVLCNNAFSMKRTREISSLTTIHFALLQVAMQKIEEEKLEGMQSVTVKPAKKVEPEFKKQKIDDSKKINGYSCNHQGCGFVTKHETWMATHQNMHTQRDDGATTYQCDTCYYLTNTKKYFEIHQVIHQNEKKHFCVPCNKGFTTNRSLKRHKEKSCHQRLT
jgi:hypothetical protein